MAELGVSRADRLSFSFFFLFFALWRDMSNMTEENVVVSTSYMNEPPPSVIMSVSHIVSAVGLSRMCCSLSPSPGHSGSYSEPRHRSSCPSEVLVFV